MFFNDRRNARFIAKVNSPKNKARALKAATAPKKRGPVKSSPVSPNAQAFNKEERYSVKQEAQNVAYENRNNKGREKNVFGRPNKSDYAVAAQRVEKDPEKYTGYVTEQADYYRNNQEGKPKKKKARGNF